MQTLRSELPSASPQEALSVIAKCVENLRTDVTAELSLLEKGSIPFVTLKPKNSSQLLLIYVFSALGTDAAGKPSRGFSVVASFSDRPCVSLEMLGTGATLQVIRDLLDWRPNPAIDSMTRSRLEFLDHVSSPDTQEHISLAREESFALFGIYIQHEQHVMLGDTMLIIEQIGESYDTPTTVWRLTAIGPDCESGMIELESIELDSFEDVLCVIEQIEAVAGANPFTVQRV